MLMKQHWDSPFNMTERGTVNTGAFCNLYGRQVSSFPHSYVKELFVENKLKAYCRLNLGKKGNICDNPEIFEVEKPPFFDACKKSRHWRRNFLILRIIIF